MRIVIAQEIIPAHQVRHFGIRIPRTLPARRVRDEIGIIRHPRPDIRRPVREIRTGDDRSVRLDGHITHHGADIQRGGVRANLPASVERHAHGDLRARHAGGDELLHAIRRRPRPAFLVRIVIQRRVVAGPQRPAALEIIRHQVERIHHRRHARPVEAREVRGVRAQTHADLLACADGRAHLLDEREKVRVIRRRAGEIHPGPRAGVFPVEINAVKAHCHEMFAAVDEIRPHRGTGRRRAVMFAHAPAAHAGHDFHPVRVRERQQPRRARGGRQRDRPRPHQPGDGVRPDDGHGRIVAVIVGAGAGEIPRVRGGGGEIPLRTQVAVENPIIPGGIDVAIQHRRGPLHLVGLPDALVAEIAAVQRPVIRHAEEAEVQVRVLRVIDIEMVQVALHRQAGTGRLPRIPLRDVADHAFAMAGGGAGGMRIGSPRLRPDDAAG